MSGRRLQRNETMAAPQRNSRLIVVLFRHLWAFLLLASALSGCPEGIVQWP